MKFQLAFSTLLLAAANCIFTATARADAIVLSNLAQRTVEVRVTLPGEEPRDYKLEPKQAVPVPVIEEAAVEFNSGGERKQYRVGGNSIAYFFCKDISPNVVEFSERSFAGNRKLPAAPKAADKGTLARLRKIGIIPVKLFVDDDEPAVQMIWEKRLTERLEQASDVLEKCCLLRLKVTDAGMWDSLDGVTDFTISMREFEKEVHPGPKAVLAMGFSSQYDKPDGRVHLGGTRGPLYPFILIREWSQHVAYSERVEVVVHEMGHVLGAAHSPDMFSVMRPLVNDGRARVRDYKTAFDPLNTLAMYIFCEQLRLHNAVSLRQFTPESRAALCRIYAEMQKEMPKDDSARRYIAMMQAAEKPAATQSAANGRAVDAAGRAVARQNEANHRHASDDPAQAKTLVAAARIVVDAIRTAAENNKDVALAPPPDKSDEQNRILKKDARQTALAGDGLSEYYVRSAAAAAQKLPPQFANKAFLLGLAVGLDKSDGLNKQAVTARMAEHIESEEMRRRRTAALGNPTMNGRVDLLQHFAVSAALAAMVGEDAARVIAVAKETSDGNGGTGFSFRDLAADLAGIHFAKNLIAAKLRLSDLAAMFFVDAFMPPVDDLPEELTSQQFQDRFGSTGDARFHTQEELILRRIVVLPGYGRE